MLRTRYEANASLFLKKVIDAIPSVMLGMDFGSRSPIHGNQVGELPQMTEAWSESVADLLNLIVGPFRISRLRTHHSGNKR